MGFRETLKMVSLIAGSVVAVGSAVTWGVNAWTGWGWVTKATYQADSSLFVTQAAFERHIAEQEGLNATGQQTQNEILAYVKYVPELKQLLRNRCMGGSVPQGTIDDYVRTIEELTSENYDIPSCDELLPLQ